VAWELIVAHDEDGFNGKWGGRGCGGEDCRVEGGWTDIVVRKDAMMAGCEVSVQDGDGVCNCTGAVTFLSSVFWLRGSGVAVVVPLGAYFAQQLRRQCL
jgi:hypothetical protein